MEPNALESEVLECITANILPEDEALVQKDEDPETNCEAWVQVENEQQEAGSVCRGFAEKAESLRSKIASSLEEISGLRKELKGIRNEIQRLRDIVPKKSIVPNKETASFTIQNEEVAADTEDKNTKSNEGKSDKIEEPIPYKTDESAVDSIINNDNDEVDANQKNSNQQEAVVKEGEAETMVKINKAEKNTVTKKDESELVVSRDTNEIEADR